MRKITPFFGLLILLSFSCSKEPKEKHVDTNRIIHEVKSTFNDYVKHVNHKGINGVESFFSKDERFYWIEDGIMQYPNRKALLSAIESFYPTVKTISLHSSKVNVEVLEPKTAMVYVEYVQDVLLISGYKLTLDGAMTILTVKDDDAWKFLIGHSSIKKPRGEN